MYNTRNITENCQYDVNPKMFPKTDLEKNPYRGEYDSDNDSNDIHSKILSQWSSGSHYIDFYRKNLLTTHCIFYDLSFHIHSMNKSSNYFYPEIAKMYRVTESSG